MRSYFRWVCAAGLALAPAVLNAGEPASHNQVMAEQIAQVLQSNGQFDGCRIMIEYAGGVATLKGTVNTPWQRYEALQLARGTHGVGDVLDGLAVLRGAAPQLPSAGYQQTASYAPQARGPVQPVRGYYMQEESLQAPIPGANGGGIPSYASPAPAPVRYDLPHFPPYAWPSYSSYPNYASLTYPQQYSATAWPYIGPFYPYPQVPMGWRKVSLEWDDGWWFLEFDD